MAAEGVLLDEQVRKIIEKCEKDEEYNLYVKDCVTRSKKDFERNPNIENTGGYIVSAILKNYHKKAREKENEAAQKEAVLQAEKNQLKKINALVTE